MSQIRTFVSHLILDFGSLMDKNRSYIPPNGRAHAPTPLARSGRFMTQFSLISLYPSLAMVFQGE